MTITMFKFNEFILKESDENLSSVSREEADPSKKMTPMQSKISQFIADCRSGKFGNSNSMKISENGVKLAEKININIISEANENFELTFLDNEKGYPNYIIKTQNSEINASKVKYIILDDITYNKVIALKNTLNGWLTKIKTPAPAPNQQQQNAPVPNQQQNPQQNQQNPYGSGINIPKFTSSTTNQSFQESSISKFSELIKLYEEINTPITSELFSNYTLKQLDNPKIFGKYEKFKEVSAVIKSLEKYPDLYNKKYSEFITLKNIIPESKKNKYITKWSIEKLNTDSDTYGKITIGGEIKPGNNIYFFNKNKRVKIKVKSISVKTVVPNQPVAQQPK